MPSAKRPFRPDNGQADAVFLGEADEFGEIGGGNGDVLAVDVGARIARGHEYSFHARTLGEFPSQGVFASAAAYEQNIHATILMKKMGQSPRTIRFMRNNIT